MVKKLTTMPTNRPYIARIRGYAGTGKTTMLRVLGSEIGSMAVITPTGKSALRVTEATSLSASTAHRWMYTPREDQYTGRVTFQRNTRDKMVRPDSGVIVLDEASMVGLDLWEDIHETAQELNCHVLAVGDPFQLPPVEEVRRNDPFGILEDNFRFDLNTDLTEVTRQAKESPIIRASMMIREGHVEAAVMSLPRVKESELLQEQLQVLANKGVVICYKNASRHELNARVREAQKLPRGGIVEGEPLLVLRNNYDLNRFNGEVLNFEGWIRIPAKQWEVYHRFKDDVQKSSFGLARVDGDECVLAMGAVSGRMDAEWVGPCIGVSKEVFGEKVPYLHCNYGQTLTCHKSQGSEWDNVVVCMEPSLRINTKDGRRWAYTAVTRGKKSVKIAWGVKIA